MRPDLLDTMCSDLLAAAVQAYDAPGAPPVPTPAFIAHGPAPTADGEQLTVACTQIVPQSTDARTMPCAVVPVATFTVRVWRPWTPRVEGTVPANVRTPDPADIGRAASILARDGAVLWSLVGVALAGALFPNVPGLDCALLTPGALVPLPPSGELAGWQWTLAAQLAV